MSNNHEIELKTDCEAIQIPAGLKTTIPAGTKVIITQSLGGSYTIACDYGLFRISEDNAAALGLGEHCRSGVGLRLSGVDRSRRRHKGGSQNDAHRPRLRHGALDRPGC